MLIRLNGIVSDSIVDGPGLRLAVFTQGCPHHCPGCHNPATHDPEGGYAADTAAVLASLKENPLLDGLTLTGGEPFEQPEACLELALGAKSRGLTVWAYSGYTYEALMKKGGVVAALLDACDVLVDGPFVLAQRSLELDFRGSRNQRLVDVPQSRRAGQATLWQRPSW